ncbi:MAG: MbtH family protein [Pseudonocardiaceae bacterium]
MLTHLEINWSEESALHVDRPFHNKHGTCYSLINDEGQYSLWPAFADVSAGQAVAHGEGTWKSCLDYIEGN